MGFGTIFVCMWCGRMGICPYKSSSLTLYRQISKGDLVELEAHRWCISLGFSHFQHEIYERVHFVDF